VLALAVAILGLVLVRGDIRAAGTFNVDIAAKVSDKTGDVNADVTTNFNVPDPDGTTYQFEMFFTFAPKEFYPSELAPVGAQVGIINSFATLGVFNSACKMVNEVHIPLWEASIDKTGCSVGYRGEWEDLDANGLYDGIDCVPDFLPRMIPGGTWVERFYGFTLVGGQPTNFNIVTLEAGNLPGYPASLGRPSVAILNDIGDPGRSYHPGDALTDYCAPLSSETITYGLSKDTCDGIAPLSPPSFACVGTPEDLSDSEVRRNPACGGTYTWTFHAESMRDPDGDGYETYLDTCPFDVNLDNSPKVDTGPDGDGIDSVCEAPLRASDPTWPATKPCWPGAPGNYMDCDKDGYLNRLDNCPTVPNGCTDAECAGSNPYDPSWDNQADADADMIGDTCDTSPPGNGKNTPDGARIVTDPDLTADVDIDGLDCTTGTPTPTPTPTPAGSVTPTVTVPSTVISTVTTTPTATVPPVEDICPPVIPGTYNGLVRLNGAPAPSGYEVIAKVADKEWGSATVSGGRYAMDIPGHLSAGPPCFEAGALAFEINGAKCTTTPTADTFAAGLHDVDLSCAAVATATPTPAATTTPAASPTKTATATATATTTPAKPPPSGGGGLSGDQGLPPWAIVLAGWCSLMVLAGLGTVATRIVKR
jgi:hypothetical protein